MLLINWYSIIYYLFTLWNSDMNSDILMDNFPLTASIVSNSLYPIVVL